jgi:protein-S-isoprenylcysteine O-methyltransferase Ste14
MITTSWPGEPAAAFDSEKSADPFGAIVETSEHCCAWGRSAGQDFIVTVTAVLLTIFKILPGVPQPAIEQASASPISQRRTMVLGRAMGGMYQLEVLPGQRHWTWTNRNGLSVFVLGLALAVWARVYLGRNWGMPMSQRADPELVTTGPYARIRHPIYSGVIIGTVGTEIAVSPYWLNAVAILGAYFLFSAMIEERTMARLFPAAYPPYKGTTKMLIPYIL